MENKFYKQIQECAMLGGYIFVKTCIGLAGFESVGEKGLTSGSEGGTHRQRRPFVYDS